MTSGPCKFNEVYFFMANVTAAQVKELRELTGAGMMDCREALQNADGDVKKAQDWLRQKGMAKADKKASRSTSEGRIGHYIHTNGKLGVLVELLCETDFVAKNEMFQKLMNDLCMQVAAMSPEYVGREQVPAEYITRETEGYRKAAMEEGKPEAIAEKIAVGKVEKYLEGICLLEQPFIRDDSMKVKDLVRQTIGTLGENIVVKRFVRYVVGE